MKQELLRVENVTVLDYDVRMLNQAWFYIGIGETIGILGRHDSGRAELVKVICGKERMMGARLYYKEKLQAEWNTDISAQNGIFCISDFDELFLDFDVTFNIFLRHDKGSGFLVHKSSLYKRCVELLDELGISISPDTLVDQLDQSEKLMIMIARAVVLKAKLLVLENVISVMDEFQLQRFLVLFPKLNKMGISVALFDGDIQAISLLAKRVIVIRDGRIVSNCKEEQISEKCLTTVMLGKEMDICLDSGKVPKCNSPVLQLYYKEETGRRQLFSVSRGSLTGIVVGPKMSAAKMERIFEGKDSSYEIVVNGEIVNAKTLEKHIGLVREHSIVFENMDLEENIALRYQEISSRMLCINSRQVKIAMNNQVKPFFRKELKDMYRKKNVNTLRHSEKKVLEICRNLIKKPEVMVYINPVYRTGSISSRYLLEKIRKVQNYGYTSLLVSDSVQICSAICNHILFFKNNSVAGEFFMDTHSAEEVLDFYRNEFWKRE